MTDCSEVSINLKRMEEGKKSIKKEKRCEVNYLTDNPEGPTDESLEKERSALQEETKKRLPKKALIDPKMEVTFALGRKEIVEEE